MFNITHLVDALVSFLDLQIIELLFHLQLLFLFSHIGLEVQLLLLSLLLLLLIFLLQLLLLLQSHLLHILNNMLGLHFFVFQLHGSVFIDIINIELAFLLILLYLVISSFSLLDSLVVLLLESLLIMLFSLVLLHLLSQLLLQ